jgi:ssDNA-binding Zn-finger/Zn-ribbon topoisomerase 1
MCVNLQWGDRFPYLEYIRHLDVRQLIEANQVVDTGASPDGARALSCYLCGGPASAVDAIRLNHGKWICATCFVQLQHTKYPEKYQRMYEGHMVAAEAWKRASADLNRELETMYPTAKLVSRVGASEAWCGIGIAVGVILVFVVPAVGLPLLALSILVLSVSVSALNHQIRSRLAEIERAKRAWLDRNPAPSEPQVKDFHDPSAELTARDELIQEVFDYWPGYPPFWSYVRRIVLDRDRRCQITGCPSRTEMHVHHKQPLGRGGSHHPDNLVALCAFHHGMQPDVGHERVWLEISTQYFSLVCAHMRAGAFVSAHKRRRSLATEQELLTILRFHAVTCPDCGSELLCLSVDYGANKVRVGCNACGSEWRVPQKLTEETGPQLCDLLKPTRNILAGEVDWQLLAGQDKAIGGHRSKKRPVRKMRVQERRCPLCGSPLALRNWRRGPFWGCTSYPRCRYTRGHDGC